MNYRVITYRVITYHGGKVISASPAMSLARARVCHQTLMEACQAFYEQGVISASHADQTVLKVEKAHPTHSSKRTA